MSNDIFTIDIYQKKFISSADAFFNFWIHVALTSESAYI